MAIRKIMVVDDSPADLQNLKGILQKGGHQVIEVASGQDSIAKAKADAAASSEKKRRIPRASLLA